MAEHALPSHDPAPSCRAAPDGQASGARAAIAEYQNLKRTRPNDYDFSEFTLEELGWALTEMDRLPDAIAIYPLNVSPAATVAVVYNNVCYLA